MHVKGGIKSLDPPCLEDALSFGDYPYTCANCANQLRQLKDILRHRLVGSWNSLANRIGHVGFNKRYARKGEFSEALNKEVDRRKGAVKQVSALLQVKLSPLEWENQLQESCRYGDDQKLIMDNGVLANVVSLFKNLPVNEASDGARSLRYLQPFMTTAGEVVLLGQSWNPDVNRWAEDVLPIPRRNTAHGDVDDFGALKRTIDDIIERNEQTILF